MAVEGISVFEWSPSTSSRGWLRVFEVETADEAIAILEVLADIRLVFTDVKILRLTWQREDR